jgi:hypothetical protein
MLIELTELALIRRNAEDLLRTLGQARTVHIVDKLKPRDEDYEAVFIGDAAAKARAGYADLWTSPPKSLARPDQTNVIAFAASAEKFATDNEYSREFPGGYRKVADKLKPGLVWVRFKYTVPGSDAGMAYDGMVFLQDHWAWFPKPWRVLADESLVDN